MTLLIDTNVILDYVLKREPLAQFAYECLERFIYNKDKYSLWLTASTITDIYYITRRSLNNDMARSVIEKLVNGFNIAAVDKNDLLSALAYNISDYEDALQAQCAVRIYADYILTNNTSDFINSPIKAITPKEFLA
ncbi:MAG: PIN domain-containing protein [Defluviitaleaceae bacterium]|nr:PIN domain-containing protein [Defluviitaleaceae bacterium]